MFDSLFSSNPCIINLMKSEILKLREAGKSYKEICDALGCSKGTVSYHCGRGQKQKTRDRANIWRNQVKDLFLKEKGGACQICGYNKCKAALEFHHLDPSKKDPKIKGELRSPRFLREVKELCILVCANCHREIHDGQISDATLNNLLPVKELS